MKYKLYDPYENDYPDFNDLKKAINYFNEYSNDDYEHNKSIFKRHFSKVKRYRHDDIDEILEILIYQYQLSDF